jgi:hypothetical protein
LTDLTPQPQGIAPEREVQIQALLRSLAQDDLGERRRALRAVAALEDVDERLIAAIVELLRGQDLPLREMAAATLAGMGGPAVGSLIAALSSDDADFRKAIVVTLALMGPPAHTAIPVLRDLVDEEGLGPWARRALERIEQRPGRGPVAWPWLVAGGAALVLVLAGSLAARVGVSAGVPPAAMTAGLTLGGLGVVMGLLLGRQGGAREAGLMAASFGLGGAFAGGLLAWLLASLVAPVVKALGG